jgi:hypothetical protein
VALTANVFRKKNVSRSKGFHRAVANADLDGTGQCDTPLAAWRVMPAVQIVSIEVVFENQSFCAVSFHEFGAAFSLIQVFEMGLAVCSSVNAAE